MPINKKLVSEDIKKNDEKINKLKEKLEQGNITPQQRFSIKKQIMNAKVKGGKLLDLSFDAFNEYGTNPKAYFQSTSKEKLKIPAKYKISYKKLNSLSKAERKGKI
tara:strand:+ start:208 stop:525 length:318 start_codon:yes stop_codon:yes gene_type:complete